MSNNMKKIKIIKTFALKRKVKLHFMKWGDNVLASDKHQSNSLFWFSTSMFQFFLFPKWVLKKILWRNYKDNLKISWKRSKRDWESCKNLQTFCLCSLGLQKKVHLFLFQFINFFLLRNPLQYPRLRELLKQLEKTREIVRKNWGDITLESPWDR